MNWITEMLKIKNPEDFLVNSKRIGDMTHDEMVKALHECCVQGLHWAQEVADLAEMIKVSRGAPSRTPDFDKLMDRVEAGEAPEGSEWSLASTEWLTTIKTEIELELRKRGK
jgi:hypothetical protein